MRRPAEKPWFILKCWKGWKGGYLGVGDGCKMQLAVQGQEVHVVREVLLVVCNLIVRSLPSLINISTIDRLGKTQIGKAT